jgi:copper chaperone CopZ
MRSFILSAKKSYKHITNVLKNLDGIKDRNIMTVEVFTVANIYTTQNQNLQDSTYTLSIRE